MVFDPATGTVGMILGSLLERVLNLAPHMKAPVLLNLRYSTYRKALGTSVPNRPGALQGRWG